MKGKNKMVLSFMCKNEENVIIDMLNSCLPIMDNLVALDTGSTDNTIDVIKNFCYNNGVYFEIYQRPFDNFMNSRNALKNYTLEYINEFYKNYNDNIYWFSIDCDDIMIIDKNHNNDNLQSDVYDITIRTNSIIYRKKSIFKIGDDGKWDGIVHEDYYTNNKVDYLDTLSINVRHSGNSWNDINKHLKQALLYENNILNGNNNIRAYFYTGETYILSNKNDRAFEYFHSLTNKFEVNDSNKEYIFYSYFQMGNIEYNKGNIDNSIDFFLKAHEVDNRRFETINLIINHYLNKKMYHSAFIYSKYCIDILKGRNPYPECGLYIYEDLYKYLLYYNHILLCHILNKIDGIDICMNILIERKNILPDFIIDNLRL